MCNAGRPVDVMDNRGWRPTHESAYANHVDCLDHLLLQGENDEPLCKIGAKITCLFSGC